MLNNKHEVDVEPSDEIDRTHKETSAQEVVKLLTSASKVIIVPG